MDKLNFLESASADDLPRAADPAPAPEPVAAEPAPAAEPLPDAVPADPVVEVKPEPVMVPLAALHETRDKVKDLEARLAALAPKAPAPEIPDPNLDPDAHTAYRLAETNAAIANTRLDMSEAFAREKHGEELVDAARDWALTRFQQSPAFHQEVLNQKNPWGYAVQQFQRQSAVDKLGDTSEIDAFLAWKAAQGQGSTIPVPAAAADLQPAPAIPTRSLASAPSAGGGIDAGPTGPGVAYANLFGS